MRGGRQRHGAHLLISLGFCHLLPFVGPPKLLAITHSVRSTVRNKQKEHDFHQGSDNTISEMLLKVMHACQLPELERV